VVESPAEPIPAEPPPEIVSAPAPPPQPVPSPTPVPSEPSFVPDSSYFDQLLDQLN
jgi:hypothetical protein